MSSCTQRPPACTCVEHMVIETVGYLASMARGATYASSRPFTHLIARWTPGERVRRLARRREDAASYVISWSSSLSKRSASALMSRQRPKRFFVSILNFVAPASDRLTSDISFNNPSAHDNRYPADRRPQGFPLPSDFWRPRWL